MLGEDLVSSRSHGLGLDLFPVRMLHCLWCYLFSFLSQLLLVQDSIYIREKVRRVREKHEMYIFFHRILQIVWGNGNLGENDWFPLTE
jgi:hypothetical protein